MAAIKEYPQLIVWALKQTPLVIILLFANYIQFQQVQKLEFKIETMQAKMDLYMLQGSRKTSYLPDKKAAPSDENYSEPNVIEVRSRQISPFLMTKYLKMPLFLSPAKL